MLEGADGFEILKRIKSTPALSDVAVIMVSAKGAEIDKVKGLNLGADDYVAKPFGILEIIARINANIRKKAKKPTFCRIRISELTILNTKFTWRTHPSFSPSRNTTF